MTEIFYDNLSLNQNQTKPLTGSFVMEDWNVTLGIISIYLTFHNCRQELSILWIRILA